MIKKDVKWTWTNEHQDALENLKRSLTTSAMSYFNTEWKTVITVDASPIGLGAVLAQYDPKDPETRKVVMYASRSLTDVETRYSQVEKESLALVWALEKFHLYIFQ